MMRQSVEDAALAPRTQATRSRSASATSSSWNSTATPSRTVAVHTYDMPDGAKAREIACLFVRRAHKNKGHGRKLVAYAEEVAKQRGCAWIFALSTQAFRFFEEKLGYAEDFPDSLPTPKKEAWEKSGRNSKGVEEGIEVGLEPQNVRNSI